MSSLEVSAVQLDDVKATNALIFAAFASNIFVRILYPNGVTPAVISHFVEQDTKGWHKDPRVRHIQVKDARTGEIISYSHWFIYPERSRAEVRKPVKMEWPEGCDGDLNNGLFNNGKMKRDEIMGGKPYIFLATLVTSPPHQRRGCGQLLLEWGIQQAQTLNLPIYLEATPTGRPLYERMAFKPVDHINIDLTSLGIPTPQTHTCMVYPAPSPHSPPVLPPPSTYSIAPVTSPADFPRLAHIEHVSFKTDATMALCFPGSQSTAGRAAQHANFFRTDRSVRFVKATDSRSGSIVAWARWNFYVDGATPDQTPWPKEWAEGTNVPCVEDFFGALDGKRDAFMKGKEFFLMGVLVTLPEYQGKGIGSSLLQWGLEIADEKGVECWIDASPMSVELYKRMGWVEVDHVDVDLGKYGGEQGIVDRTVCLIRKPGGGEWKVEGGTYYS